MKSIAEQISDLAQQIAARTPGFESPLGMELWGPVDWLLNREKCAATVRALREGLTRWPGGRDAAQRKQELFPDEWLVLAMKRLSNSALLPQPSLNLA